VVKEERAHEFRKNYFLSADGFSLPLRISPVRGAVQRQLQLRLEPGAIYIVDRDYIDFARLHHIHQAAGFFVT